MQLCLSKLLSSRSIFKNKKLQFIKKHLLKCKVQWNSSKVTTVKLHVKMVIKRDGRLIWSGWVSKRNMICWIKFICMHFYLHFIYKMSILVCFHFCNWAFTALVTKATFKLSNIFWIFSPFSTIMIKRSGKTNFQFQSIFVWDFGKFSFIILCVRFT